MASVRNLSDPVAPTESNVVLYQMMMHYKRRMESAEAEVEKQLKRIKCDSAAIDDLTERNVILVDANRRGAHVAIRKHHAGMRLVNCLDEIFTAIELVEHTTIREHREIGVDYIAMKKDEIQQRATMAFELLTGEHDDMLANEEIDLVTTEEEESEGEDE